MKYSGAFFSLCSQFVSCLAPLFIPLLHRWFFSSEVLTGYIMCELCFFFLTNIKRREGNYNFLSSTLCVFFFLEWKAQVTVHGSWIANLSHLSCKTSNWQYFQSVLIFHGFCSQSASFKNKEEEVSDCSKFLWKTQKTREKKLRFGNNGCCWKDERGRAIVTVLLELEGI